MSSLDSGNYGRPYLTSEVELLKTYPGGFDRLFFTRYLRQAFEEFKQAHDSAEIIVTLADGTMFGATQVSGAMTFVIFHTEGGEVVLVPNREVARVVLRERSGPQPRTPIGFRVVEEDEGGTPGPSS